MKTNYHTHTYRCKHAVGSDERYVKAALDGGFDELGFSEHCPLPYKSGFRSPYRMDLFLLEDYLESVRELKARYADKIEIRVGFECEYFPEYMDWIRDMLEETQADYAFFGNHNFPDDEVCDFFGHCVSTPEMLGLYLESALKGMETPHYSFMAHPDLFMRAYPEFDSHCEKASRKICEKAARLGLPLEYNISGSYHEGGGEGFPHPKFWQIAADCGCVCIIGCDAHDSRRLCGPRAAELYSAALAHIKKLGLKRIDRPRFLR
ncbi:MAG: histidinol-phosphatase [Oscillospiraceae bacterium]|nr:histidinol-phosphatase [Oscillospiraceae bacterium]